MQKIFSKPAELEKLAKEKFSVPPFLMMEKAAQSMADFILANYSPSKSYKKILIVCGKGNNGGDGYVLARLLKNFYTLTVVALEPPATEEAQIQSKKYQEVEGKILNHLPENMDFQIIVDCIYGIGFHGELKDSVKNVLDKMNETHGIRIACDVPSAFYFNADFTITMGELKTSLFSDKAKTVCGEILVSDLGLSRDDFQSCLPENAFLIEETDIKLPLRNNKAAHKGTYGHTTVFSCDKAGAAIIAATAAMNFGSGLTTILKTQQTDLEQFKISPELMISETIPAKTTAIVFGPGVVDYKDSDGAVLLSWMESAKNPAVVFDAGVFASEKFVELLNRINKLSNARIILTPHLLELIRLLENIIKINPGCELATADYNVESLSKDVVLKIKAGQVLNKLFPQTTVIMKSANTFIASAGKTYIMNQGCQSLAKGGSGDVLAGMVGALLAQGYSAKDAAVTATMQHALAARTFGKDAYNLTPSKLINLI